MFSSDSLNLFNIKDTFDRLDREDEAMIYECVIIKNLSTPSFQKKKPREKKISLKRSSTDNFLLA